MSFSHNQSGEDASEEDDNSPREDSSEEEDNTSGEDSSEEDVDMNGENPSEDDADEPLNSEDDDMIGESPSGSGDVDDPSPPRTRLPSRQVVLQQMRQIRDAHGIHSAEWNALLSWIEARHRSYIGIREDLAREDRDRQPRDSDDSELDDPDKTESDSSAGPSRRNRRPRSPTPPTDNDSGSVVGQKTSSSSSDDKEPNLRASYGRQVLTISLGDSRRVTIKCSSPQQANADNQEIKDSGSNRSSPQAVDEGVCAVGDKSGEAYSAKYQPSEFILKSGEQVDKMCGSPIAGREHLAEQAGVIERERAASSSGTSPPNNSIANKPHEEPKPKDQQNKPSS